MTRQRTLLAAALILLAAAAIPIIASVQKTGRCIVAHEAPKTQGFGAEIAAEIMENCFLHLEAPVMRCCGLDTPFPNALEKEYLPDANRVIQEVINILNY